MRKAIYWTVSIIVLLLGFICWISSESKEAALQQKKADEYMAHEKAMERFHDEAERKVEQAKAGTIVERDEHGNLVYGNKAIRIFIERYKKLMEREVEGQSFPK